MNNLNPIKQSPMMGQTGLGGGAASLGRWTSSDSTKYIDQLFSTYVWIGNGSHPRSISNGLDLSNKGGMTWMKDRDQVAFNYLFDTERTTSTTNSYAVYSDRSNPQGNNYDGLDQFNDDGFRTNGNLMNASTEEYVSWSFVKNKKFFDIQTYSGDGVTGRTVSHNLGVIPGCIMIKCTSHDESWAVYHRGVSDTPQNSALTLDTDDQLFSSASYWNNTAPTSTQFSLKNYGGSNDSGKDYVAYIFAGGASSAATASCVDFDGTTDELEVSDSADFDYGSGDFTLELWINPNINDHTNKLIHAHTSGSNEGPCNLFFDASGTNMLTLYSSSNGSSFDVASGTEFGIIPAGSWTHIAVAREGNRIRMFRNGLHVASLAVSGSMMNPTGTFDIGGRNGANFFNGKISNFRVVKGTAVYTTSFKVPTEPLTAITNTVLLCCNHSSNNAASTVVPSGSSITANGDPTAGTDSPFDDPDGFAFGEDEDENIIKMGKYIGNGATTGPEIYLGWQPQWIMMKRIDSAGDWAIFDTMRGIPTAASDYYLKPNTNAGEGTAGQTIELTGNSFKLRYGQTISNVNDATYVYVAIRSADGIVGKLPEAGTEAFNMDTGNSSSTIPVFDSAFPVDWALITKPAETLSNYVATRLSAGQELITDGNSGSASAGNNTFDSNVGWRKGGSNADFLSWMWKRNAGMDVVVFRGTANDTAYGGQRYAHSLGTTPELKIMKRMDTSGMNWITTGTVISQALASNNNSKDYYINLNGTGGATNFSNYWDGNDTSIDFSVRSGNGEGGGAGGIFQVILLASIEGISKLGSYTGQSAGYSQTITTGFQPRFLLVKCVSSNSTNWEVYDTARGWASGEDKRLELNLNQPQAQTQDVGDPTSTGFSVNGGKTISQNGETYIYYCIA